MATNLGRLTVRRKSGNKAFRDGNRTLPFDLLNFWQWSTSDLVSNATRGVLAEYIVARALGLAETDVRDEWAPFDLATGSHIRGEVKSAAYVQSWRQNQLSNIVFRTPKTRAWDPETNILSDDAKRQADVYVFALLAHREKESIDPLDLSQWRFYVLPTVVLDRRSRSQHPVTLPTLGGSSLQPPPS